ncbi:MAG TPA: cobalamin-binding protein [Candidatus Dormibacteraeota bacterium]|nr:cobalamin-binding protein [Candidatus Dormibacteraeota bacterium]
MRIVSLLPSATEILFALGVGEHVVGVTHECDVPEAARALPKVTGNALEQGRPSGEIDRHVRAAVHGGSSIYRLDRDALERLRPDLVVTQELCGVCAVSYAEVSTAVKRMTHDARVVSLDPHTLDEVLDTFSTLGELVGAPERALALCERFRGELDELRRRGATLRRLRLLFLEWLDPPMNAGHWNPELLEAAGVETLLSAPGRDAHRVTWEAIVEADPDAILAAPCGMDVAAVEDELTRLAAVPEWQALRAVANGAVCVLDGSRYFARPGPSLVEGARLLQDWVEAYFVPSSGQKP